MELQTLAEVLATWPDIPHPVQLYAAHTPRYALSMSVNHHLTTEAWWDLWTTSVADLRRFPQSDVVAVVVELISRRCSAAQRYEVLSTKWDKDQNTAETVLHFFLRFNDVNEQERRMLVGTKVARTVATRLTMRYPHDHEFQRAMLPYYPIAQQLSIAATMTEQEIQNEQVLRMLESAYTQPRFKKDGQLQNATVDIFVARPELASDPRMCQNETLPVDLVKIVLDSRAGVYTRATNKAWATAAVAQEPVAPRLTPEAANLAKMLGTNCALWCAVLDLANVTSSDNIGDLVATAKALLLSAPKMPTTHNM